MPIKKNTSPLLFAIALCLFLTPCSGQSALQKRTLKVGVAGNPPFIMDRQQQTGISLEIWQGIANMEDLTYDLVPFDDVPKALEALDSGSLDAVVGPISITSDRAKSVQFSQPYFMSSLSIMSNASTPSIWQRVKPFFSAKFFYAIIIFLFILAIVGTLLWLAERKKNPDEFPQEPARGIANGMWCAIVTMSTTGYGDRSPSTLWGRIIAGSWMVISIVFATTMVAGIASTLTLSGFATNTISKAEQLQNKKVAVINDSPAEDLVNKYNGQPIYVQSLQEGYNLLTRQKADAIVYDRAQLLYFLKTHHNDEIAVSPNEYLQQGYGFVVSSGSSLLKQINIGLLSLQESGRIDQIISTRLGKNKEQ